MHQVDLDITLDELTKVEGAAALDVKVRGGFVEHVHFKITEYKRFFTQAMQGKPAAAVPQLLARICGTCSNAHLMCSIQAFESAMGIVPSEQTRILRSLTMNGLIIRDHALHLYLFVMPDIFHKDAFLEFDESDPLQHQMLHDGFEVKAAGNHLAMLVAGRSVHAPHPVIGGFMHFPEKSEIDEVIKKLESARGAALRLINVFNSAPFHFDRKTKFMAQVPAVGFGFSEGEIVTDHGEKIPREQYLKHLEHVILPYSQASAYKRQGEPFMVGALARLNLAAARLHERTKADAAEALKKFPSTDIYHNNLAQAVEVLHCIDESLDILKSREFLPEPVIKGTVKDAVGAGVVEAPRGTLYHRVHLGADGNIIDGEIVVPTGQNQTNIEEDIATLVERMLPQSSKEEIVFEIEKLIRAYDPCMSCGAHFLKVNWR